MALRTVFAMLTTGVVLQAWSLAGAGIASADLQVPPTVAATVCPGGRFHPVQPDALTKYANEAALCVVYGPKSAEDNIEIVFAAYASAQTMRAEAGSLPRRHYPVFSYAALQETSRNGTFYFLVIASAFVEDPPPSVRPIARELISRMAQFGFKVHDM